MEINDNIFLGGPPKMVGGYRLGKGTFSWKLNLANKPKWFHRACMKLFFGIIWEDND